MRKGERMMCPSLLVSMLRCAVAVAVLHCAVLFYDAVATNSPLSISHLAAVHNSGQKWMNSMDELELTEL